MLFWGIEQHIHCGILREKRAVYGKQIVAALGRHLTAEFGAEGTGVRLHRRAGTAPAHHRSRMRPGQFEVMFNLLSGLAAADICEVGWDPERDGPRGAGIPFFSYHSRINPQSKIARSVAGGKNGGDFTLTPSVPAVQAFIGVVRGATQ